jgi:hypothetical protein
MLLVNAQNRKQGAQTGKQFFDGERTPLACRFPDPARAGSGRSAGTPLLWVAPLVLLFSPDRSVGGTRGATEKKLTQQAKERSRLSTFQLFWLIQFP